MPYANEELIPLPSLSRSTTATTNDITFVSGTGALTVVLDTTVIGTATITLAIDGKDPASGKYFNLLTGTAVSTNTTTRYRVGPNLASAANSVAQDYMPRTYRITCTQGGTGNATYSVGVIHSRNS